MDEKQQKGREHNQRILARAAELAPPGEGKGTVKMRLLPMIWMPGTAKKHGEFVGLRGEAIVVKLQSVEDVDAVLDLITRTLEGKRA